MEDNAILETFDKGQYDAVLEQLQSKDEATLSEALLIVKGISFLRTGDPLAAIRIFNIILATNPTHPEVVVYKTAAENTQLKLLLDQANECIRSSDYSNAYDLYTTISTDYSSINANIRHQITTNRAVCLLNLNRATDALAVIDDALIADSASAAQRSELYFSKAVILKQLNRSNEAFDIYTNHLTDSTELKVMLGHAETALATSNYEVAINITHTIIDTPDVAKDMLHSAYLCRAVAYLHMKRHEDALTDLSTAQNISSSSTISADSIAESNRLLQLCHTLLGDEAFEQQDYGSASTNYKQALQIATSTGTNTTTLLFNVALCSHRTGDLADAIAGYQKVLEHDSNHFAANAALGVVLLQQEESTNASQSSAEPSLSLLSATTALETAHKINTTDVEVLYNLGVCYLRSAKYTNSSSAFAKVLKLSPDHEAAKKGLGIAENMIATAATAKKHTTPTAIAAAQATSAAPPVVEIPAPAAPVVESAPPAAVPDPTPVKATVTPTYPISQLLAPGPYPSDVNPSTREIYLSPEDFQSAFGCTKEQFYGYPTWKQVAKKKQLGLF